ncbi:hypothetical protein B0H16DRAFT_1884468 [Mycena metata]|uniref:Uncharacterized protein n=1 Tax=Mycena metata TaxID=1033252 RepID=A0AAD7JCK4_9AGAR|nr:hypothetical protein B0H16DRAFT_1884468 [Mycena metata]
MVFSFPTFYSHVHFTHMYPFTYSSSPLPPRIPASHPPPSSIVEPSRTYDAANTDRHMSPDQALSSVLAVDPQWAIYQNLKDNMPDQHATAQGLDRGRKKILENINEPLDVACLKLSQSRCGPSPCDPKAIRAIVALLRAFVRRELVKNGGRVIHNFWRRFDSWLAARREGAGENWASFVDRIVAADNRMHGPPALAIATENRPVYCCKYAPLCLGPSGHRHSEPWSSSLASPTSPTSPSWSAGSSSSSAGLSSSWASGSGSTSVLNPYSDVNSDSLPQTRREQNVKQRLAFILNEER